MALKTLILIQIIHCHLLITVKSLTLSEFDSCQSKVGSVLGNLAKCYLEWERIHLVLQALF